MRVLVTGHKGYIGTRLVPMLIDLGYEVLGIDSDLYERSTFGALNQKVSEYRKDIRDVEIDDLKGVESIIHLAALSNDPLGNLNPELTYDINYRATVRLAEIAKSAGVSRFLFASSCSTYGASGGDYLDETAEFNPVTPYGETKVMAEQELAKLADDTFSPAFLRNATAYGASPRLRFDIVLNNLVAWAFTTGLVYLKSDGTPWRPIVHIEDISQAFITMLSAPRELIHAEAFNVGHTDENYQIRDIAQIVAEEVPGCKIEIAEKAGPDSRNYRVDFSKIRRVFPSFETKWDARRGCKELYEKYKSVGLTLEEFEGPRYKRLAQLKERIDAGHLNDSLRWINTTESLG